MSTAIAYGSITITDITDVGEFSVQPISNLPLTIIYDPNQSPATYTPNWGDSFLRITPIVYYAGSPVSLDNNSLTITWTKQVGTGSETAIAGNTTEFADTTGANRGILQVKANQFNADSTMLTYIVTASYYDNTLSNAIQAKGQITFSLIKNASSVKICKITGDSVFKYNGENQIQGASSITLTGIAGGGASISGWYYKNGNNWTSLNNSTTSLTINASDNYFSNDRCVIKLATNDESIYDLHTILKLYDGAAGTRTISAVLTNDDQMIPANANGQPIDLANSGATSQIKVFEGATNITSQYTITAASSDSTNLTFQQSTTDHTNDTVTITGMANSLQAGYITFTASKGNNDQNPLTKKFSLVKVSAGPAGTSPTIYSVEADNLALNKSADTTPVFTPSSVTFRAYSQTGSNAKTGYGGRFKIFENLTYDEFKAGGTLPAPKYSSTDDLNAQNSFAYTYTPSTSANMILCVLYASGGFSEVKDAQSVVITSDGIPGAPGAQGSTGPGAINVVLGNYADVLPCTVDNKLSINQTIEIPFCAYQGTQKIACNGPTPSTIKLFGVTPTVTNATDQIDGLISWTISSGTSISSATGNLSLNFSVSNTTVSQVYSWTRSSAAANGTSPIFLDIYAPNGNVFTDTINSVTLKGRLFEGSSDQTSAGGVTYQWAKYTGTGSGDGYTNLTSSDYTSVNGATLVLAGSHVQSYASYKLTANYKSNPYVAYFAVFDKHDPIQVAVFSSVGTQLVNGIGAGALYVKVTKNGTEIDNILSEHFAESNPSGASNGDYYYKLNKTNKTVTLMKYTTSWQTVSTSPYTGTYTWTWRDKDGNLITTWGSGNNTGTLPTSGKVIYIDGDMIDSKIIANVSVTI